MYYDFQKSVRCDERENCIDAGDCVSDVRKLVLVMIGCVWVLNIMSAAAKTFALGPLKRLCIRQWLHVRLSCIEKHEMYSAINFQECP